MQLTFVMMGGLGLAVSVLTFRESEAEPSLLAVNPDTDISYCVAGSGTENIVSVTKQCTMGNKGD